MTEIYEVDGMFLVDGVLSYLHDGAFIPISATPGPSPDLTPIYDLIGALDGRVGSLESRVSVIDSLIATLGAGWTHEDITPLLKFRFKTDDSNVYIGTGAYAIYSAGLHRLGDMQYIDLYVSFGDRMFTEVYADGAPRAGQRTWAWAFVPQAERIRPRVGGLGLIEFYRDDAGEGRGLGWSVWDREIGPNRDWALMPKYMDVGFANGSVTYNWPDVGGGFWKTEGSHFRLITFPYQSRV
jgi:hypothetical protein